MRPGNGTMKLSLHLIDSATGLGLDELKAKLVAATVASTGYMVPKLWLTLQQRISEFNENWQLNWKAFKERIGDGIPELEKAISVLWHPLGVCLRYEKTIPEMVIMKPQKLCDIFKCVITQHDTTKRIREQGTAASLSLASSFILLLG